MVVLLIGCGGGGSRFIPPEKYPDPPSINADARLFVRNAGGKARIPPIETEITKRTVEILDITKHADKTVSVDLRVDGVDLTMMSFGSWMAHNAFGALERSNAQVPKDVKKLLDAVGVVGYSIGNPSGSVPNANATYRGTMRGINTRWNNIRVRGDVRVDFELPRMNDPRIDILFHNISGANFNTLDWLDLKVKSDGTYASPGKNPTIEGSFYGPGHEEIGGVFSMHDVVGGYGAKKLNR